MYYYTLNNDIKIYKSGILILELNKITPEFSVNFNKKKKMLISYVLNGKRFFQIYDLEKKEIETKFESKYTDKIVKFTNDNNVIIRLIIRMEYRFIKINGFGTEVLMNNISYYGQLINIID